MSKKPNAIVNFNKNVWQSYVKIYHYSYDNLMGLDYTKQNNTKYLINVGNSVL